jgi:integrase
MRFLKHRHKSKIFDEYLEEIDNTDEDIFHVKEKNKQKQVDIITPEEANLIFDEAKNEKRDYAILKLFYYSWQRISTIQNLNINDIDYEGKINPENGKRYHTIHIKHAKNDQSYDISVDEEVINAIKRYLPDRGKPIPPEGIKRYRGRITKGYIIDSYGRKLYHKDALFLNSKGTRLMGRSIDNMMKKYAAKVGILKRIYPHLWRASGITISENNGVSISQIMKRSGHANIQSLKPYLNPNKDEINMKISNALSINNNKSTSESEKTQKTLLNQINPDNQVDKQIELYKQKIEYLKLKKQNTEIDTRDLMYS